MSSHTTRRPGPSPWTAWTGYDTVPGYFQVFAEHVLGTVPGLFGVLMPLQAGPATQPSERSTSMTDVMCARIAASAASGSRATTASMTASC